MRERSGPTTPHPCIVSHTGSVWTLPLSLAANKGISIDFSSSPYLNAFVRGVPTPTRGAAGKPAAGSPIRTSPDRRLRAPTRSLSQLATSFLSAQAKPSVRWRIMLSLLRNSHRIYVEGLCMVFTVSLKELTRPFTSKKYFGGCIIKGPQSSLCPLIQIVLF